MSERCLYNNTFKGFLHEDASAILGKIVNNYHGNAATNSIEAWQSEIEILKQILQEFSSDTDRIIFEYDIPRLSKRIDVVLLMKGIILCLEFKVGESKILEADIDQVLDYALDLSNFHKFSEERNTRDAYYVFFMKIRGTGVACFIGKSKLLRVCQSC